MLRNNEIFPLSLAFSGRGNFCFLVNILSFHVTIGFRWLFGENLGNRWWTPPRYTSRALCWNFWHGCKLWEHSYCRRQLWQGCKSVVSSNLCTSCSPSRTFSFYYFHTGEKNEKITSHICNKNENSLLLHSVDNIIKNGWWKTVDLLRALFLPCTQVFFKFLFHVNLFPL